MTPEQLNRLLTLCGALRDEVITEQEFAELDEMIRTNPKAQEIYLEYIYLSTDLCNLQAAAEQTDCLDENKISGCEGEDTGNSSRPPVTLDMLRVLGAYEKEAEIVPVDDTSDTKRPIIERVSLEKSPRTISKLSLVTAITSLAALLILLASIQFNPSINYEVATIYGSLNGQWSSDLPLTKGTRLQASPQIFHLQQGIVEIESDKGVSIVLEAPAGFHFTGPDELYLDYGQVFADVSAQGNGFTIQTKNSRIIDLGTQFGVYSDLRGETELHVYKGNTILITGLENNPRRSTEVSAGKAMRVDSSDCRVSDIEIKNQMFVQKIDPDLGLCWRGEKVLSVADVLGGGDGMGTGKRGVGINPSSRQEEEAGQYRYRYSSNQYKLSSNPYIDGLFVPNGNTPQIISSAMHVFKECPVTSGFFYSDVMYTDPQNLASCYSIDLSDYPDPNSLSLKDDPLLYMHSNAGITFDLNGFRNHFPGIQLSQFQSIVGIMDSRRPNPVPNQAEFWILADGQVRYHKLLKPNERDLAKIELKPTTRFLTLIITDGQTLEPELDKYAVGHDLCAFINPIITIK